MVDLKTTNRAGLLLVIPTTYRMVAVKLHAGFVGFFFVVFNDWFTVLIYYLREGSEVDLEWFVGK